jgi:hypothetical protein
MDIIGVYHSVKSPYYNETEKYFSQVRNKRVALESPTASLEDILPWDSHIRPQYVFIHNICKILLENQCNIDLVLDPRLLGAAEERRWYYAYEDKEDLLTDKIYQQINVLYGMVLHHLAKDVRADMLVTGICHAYDLEQLGMLNITYLGELSETVKLQANDWRTKWAVPINDRAALEDQILQILKCIESEQEN